MNVNGKTLLYVLAGAALSVLIVRVYQTTLAPTINRALSGVSGATATTGS